MRILLVGRRKLCCPSKSVWLGRIIGSVCTEQVSESGYCGKDESMGYPQTNRVCRNDLICPHAYCAKEKLRASGTPCEEATQCKHPKCVYGTTLPNKTKICCDMYSWNSPVCQQRNGDPCVEDEGRLFESTCVFRKFKAAKKNGRSANKTLTDARGNADIA
jgi:hypothetical protein